MMGPPPLPAAWPFEARPACQGLKFAAGSNLPGLAGGWHIFSASPLPEFPRHKNLDGLFGRGGLIQAGDCILRPYRRGGFVRYFNKGTYISAGRFRDEYCVHAALWGAGFPTVEPVGYAWRRHFLGMEGIYITKRAEALPWPRVWGSGDPSGQAAQIAMMIKSLAGWGLWAPDLNAANFVLGPSGRMAALDWDKAKWVKNCRLEEKYWMRLKRSMHKMDAPRGLVDSLQHELMGGQQ